MFSGLIYLLLAWGSFCLWSIGFAPYSCPSSACSAVSYIFGRPLLLWGAAYYSFSAVLCFSGLAATKRKAVLTIIYGGVAAHALLLLLAWRGTGELCPVCLKFLLVEVLLAVYVTISPPGRVFRVPAALAAAGLVVVAGLLAFNPRVVPAAAAPAVPPAKIVTAVPAEKGETAVLPKQDFVEKKTSTGLKSLPSSVKNDTNKNPGLAVTTLDKRPVTLELAARPALFVAWWCPHCDEALQEVARLPEGRRPYVVFTYLRGNDQGEIEAKLKRNGLEGTTIYLASEPTEGVKGVPALVFLDNGQVSHVEGVKAIEEKLIGK
ncbi:MAG: hypothetical protein PWQ18_653 [Clostridia bacterium]|nr:hypothetical protein [Clostridia bacterium]